MGKVVIVGAGISGLAIAFRLADTAPSLDIVVLEQQDRPGGTVWTERREGFQIEIGPNGFLDSKPSTWRLCHDLGLGNCLTPCSSAARQHRYLLLNGKLRALPGSLKGLIRTDLISWRAKLQLLAEPFRRPGRPGRDESISAFARRRAGNEVADILADALVTGIYAGDPTLLSMRASFPRLVALEERYGSVLKGMARVARQRRLEAAARGEPRPGQMWSLRRGLRELIEGICRRLPQAPVFGVRVRRLEKSVETPKWIVVGDGQERWPADAVLLACPADQQACILAELDPVLADQIAGIAYNRVAVVAAGFRDSDVPADLNGFGFIAPQHTRDDLLGVQWCSSIFPDRAPLGCVLLRALCGGWHRPEMVSWDDDRLVGAVRHGLRTALGIQAPPLFHHIIRWDRAIPQYHLGHLERVAWIEERSRHHPGLFLAGNAYHGVALNDCTEQAPAVARQVVNYLSRSPSG
jgi:oxygen-dependent protoporphyrinogen oxidase